MENGTNGFGINDIIAGRGLGIAGFGGYGYEGYGTGPANVLRESALADGTALKTASDCHSDQLNAALARISEQNLETRTSLKLDNVLSGQANTEFRNIDRNRALENLIIDGQKEAAACCCEQKLEN